MADQEKAIYRRGVRGFEPANDYAQEFWGDVKIGDLVELKGSRPRNVIFHKLWWAMLGDIARNCEPPRTSKELNFAAKVLTGTGTWEKLYSRKTQRHEHVFQPGSISFASMDEIEFQRFVRDAAAQLCANYLPGVAPDHFIQDLETLAIPR